MDCKRLILRSILENRKLSQRDIVKSLYISLGKANKLFQELIDDEMITKTGRYKITEKGQIELENFNVDNAVILACGMGVHAGTNTYEIPKCFMRVKGELLIERQIEQLQEAGIKDITIMVGFLKEKFDYLIDKYNVKLRFNEEDVEKNSLATLYHARDLIKGKNTYICPSDIYIEKSVFHQYEFEPYYCAEYLDDVKNEWQFVVNSKQEILGVIEGGEKAFCMMGPAFFTKDFSEKFIDLIESYYDMSQTDNFFWEDVLVRNLELLPTMYAYNQLKDNIFEFDNLKNLKDFDENWTTIGKFSNSYVAKVFKCSENDIHSIECINHGMTNNTYKFNINNDKNTYLCRVPVEGINEFVNRYDEKNILEALKDFNITEEVIAFDENSGIKISKCFEDAKTIDINDQNNLKSSMLILRRFHNLKVTVNVKNDIIKKIAECQETLMENAVDIAFTDYREVVKHSLEVISFVKKLKRIKTLTHGDPEAKNILFTYDGLRIIDFEYAGMTDPLSDIALFAIYSGFDVEEAFTLLKYYNEVDEKTNIAMTDIDEEKAKQLVVCYMALGGLYSCLFAICRKSISGVDYGFYNMRMYRYFKDCYKYLKSNNII